MTADAASKAAAVRFAETLAQETEEAHIAVNAVAPGALNTRHLDQLLAAGPGRVGQAFCKRGQQCENGGTPLETQAVLIAFLASSNAGGVAECLFSAVWDDWRGLPALRKKLASCDVYTVRRIVPEDRG
jgi:3-oxoacyl-[acyl-carrier protein] reductase